jgi:hypothetical protein
MPDIAMTLVSLLEADGGRLSNVDTVPGAALESGA